VYWQTPNKSILKKGMANACNREGNHTKDQCRCTADVFYDSLSKEELARLSKKPTETKEFENKFEQALRHCFNKELAKGIVKDCIALGGLEAGCQCTANNLMHDLGDVNIPSLTKTKEGAVDLRNRFKKALMACGLKPK
jgi:hypothetical protein